MRGRLIKAVGDEWLGGPSAGPAVFLAGGISNCGDWQTPVANRILTNVDITVLNPRRNDWDMDRDEEESKIQIAWEYRHLHRATHHLFWFPKETLCPITLFELGAHLGRDVKMWIGTDPDYQRKLDVEEQARLVRPDQEIWTNLDDMVSHFIHSLTVV